jgi:RHS repeat-associated protein
MFWTALMGNLPNRLKELKSNILNLRLPGQYSGSESGMFYNTQRSYLASQGRYSQSDPIGLDGGWNRYGYVSGNPLTAADPFGLDETIWRFPNGPTNGNWGGRCWGGGQQSCGDAGVGTKPATDSADACYQRHDTCYAKCGSSITCIKACDRTMVEELQVLPNDPRKWPQPPRPGTERDSRIYRDRAIGWYSIQKN